MSKAATFANANDLYPITLQVIDALKLTEKKVFVEPHDKLDFDEIMSVDAEPDSDIIFLDKTQYESETHKGRVILLTPSEFNPAIWSAEVATAHDIGGWPTHFLAQGTPEEIMEALQKYFK